MDATWVRTAHADAWEAHGRFRASRGGGVARLSGVRLMASGLSHPQWNNGDVTDPSIVDLDAVRRWYAERSVPWGLRLPADAAWPHGRFLFRKRLMGLTPDRFAPASRPPGVELRVAGPADADAVVAIDASAFDSPEDEQRPWVAPMLEQADLRVCVASLEGRDVAVGQCLVTRLDAGPAAYVAGIGVLPDARRRGIGAAVSSWLVEWGLQGGAELAHLHPEPPAAAIYARLGFAEVDGFDIYVDMG